jgi:hypothetical protein
VRGPVRRRFGPAVGLKVTDSSLKMKRAAGGERKFTKASAVRPSQDRRQVPGGGVRSAGEHPPLIGGFTKDAPIGRH